jgi:hypothetical protein
MSKKKEIKQGRKRKKTKGDKKLNKKGENAITNRTKIKRKGAKKLLQKAIKKKKPKIKIPTQELLASTLFLSNASFMVIHQSFKFLFTDSSHGKFGHPLSLLSLSVHLITPLLIGVPANLR